MPIPMPMHLSPFLMEKATPPERKDTQLESLQQQKNWNGIPMCHYQGLWCPTIFFRPMLSFWQHFKARDTDILLAYQPESGDTWMKALVFSIVNRHSIAIKHSPLLSNTTPHSLVKNFECTLYRDHHNPDLETIPSPRLFSTLLPYHLLSPSLITSKSKIICIARNPLDEFIYEREYLLKAGPCQALPVDEAFDMFCRGVHIFGPFWDNVVGYWKASEENPRKVLFVKYEEVKMDPVSSIGKIAEFVEMPFSDEERERGSIEEILNLCSCFDSSDEIGYWKNHLTSAMAERLKEIVDAKISASGLKIDDYFKV